ncbi:hypothetical protein EN829_006655 [Mesorhizobium sp. M00.F.Ca.ET.186.01.1.1]|nr:hypothetical protein EN848_02010 [bacterium M00.F.Ca.ET.205.01.1.1]TGU54624.1 hypothetical protein EN795_06425 [bacterium M00.F.Ca.ET.152.01.1.1]TGV38598.1 hypothetical protein EN829_006655 [Mesorhizobium sp. M00.F.Ca.ET.186.01.1.1]TGZ44196.1 hypothetical protein EN805_06430 [bacterium M00.F.Ca.ET.162.01.1.1]
MIAAARPVSTSAAPHRFVILGRSKERSDAAQTSGAASQPKGSMPGLIRAATVQILPRCAPWLTSRHGSSGLRDGASLLLRPWMTSGKSWPIAGSGNSPLNATTSALNESAA